MFNNEFFNMSEFCLYTAIYSHTKYQTETNRGLQQVRVTNFLDETNVQRDKRANIHEAQQSAYLVIYSILNLIYQL